MHFQWWDADTKPNALAIELYFHELGMMDKKGGGGAKSNSTYVYVFKINYHFLDLLLSVLR